MADTAIEQDEDLVKGILREHEVLKAKRKLYEPLYREIDRYIDPFGSGGFLQTEHVSREIEELYDVTAVEHLDRGTAVISGITTPRNQRWHGLAFADKDLNKLPAVQAWIEHAVDTLFTCRYVPHAGFETQINEDARQELKYGTSPLWVDEVRGHSLFYKALHLSEVYVRENYYGRVDTVHREFQLTLRQAKQQFGLNNLSDKVRSNYDDAKKRDDKIVIIQCVRPNGDYVPAFGHNGGPLARLDYRGKPIESIYLEVDTKHMIRRSGYFTMPINVSRHITGPRDEYGRSPAMKILATAKGLNAMARTILDAGNRAVDPPLLFHDDADITTLITRPGGLNPGGLDEYGRELVKPLYTGAQLPFAEAMQRQEREIVEQAFFEEFFRLLSDPSDRMTATQVVETLQKEGVLISPIAGRRETEKLGPTVERELDLLMRGQVIKPFPPEVLEAEAKPRVAMTNPLARMARAEEVSGFTRLVEIGIQAASAGATKALKVINFEQGMRDTAEVLGVRPSHIYSPEEIAAQDAADAEEKEMAMAAQVAPDAAGAALDLAKANEIATRLGQGGGL